MHIWPRTHIQKILRMSTNKDRKTAQWRASLARREPQFSARIHILKPGMVLASQPTCTQIHFTHTKQQTKQNHNEIILRKTRRKRKKWTQGTWYLDRRPNGLGQLDSYILQFAAQMASLLGSPSVAKSSFLLQMLHPPDTSNILGVFSASLDNNFIYCPPGDFLPMRNVLFFFTF